MFGALLRSVGKEMEALSEEKKEEEEMAVSLFFACQRRRILFYGCNVSVGAGKDSMKVSGHFTASVPACQWRNKTCLRLLHRTCCSYGIANDIPCGGRVHSVAAEEDRLIWL